MTVISLHLLRYLPHSSEIKIILVALGKF